MFEPFYRAGTATRAGIAGRGWGWRSHGASRRPTPVRCTSSRSPARARRSCSNCRWRHPQRARRSRRAVDRRPRKRRRCPSPGAAVASWPHEARRRRAAGAPRVLVVDDEPQIVRALKVVLREAGFEAVAGGNRLRGTRPRRGAPAGCGDRRPRAARPRRDLTDPHAAGVERNADPRALGRRRGGAEGESPGGGGGRLHHQAIRRTRAGGAPERRAAPCGVAKGEPRIVVDGLEIDLAAHVVRRDGEPVHLTPIEFDLLRVLVRNRGRLMTHRKLLAEVWGAEYVDDIQPLRTHIARLRAKIESDERDRRAALDCHRPRRRLLSLSRLSDFRTVKRASGSPWLYEIVMCAGDSLRVRDARAHIVLAWMSSTLFWGWCVRDPAADIEGIDRV